MRHPKVIELQEALIAEAKVKAELLAQAVRMDEAQGLPLVEEVLASTIKQLKEQETMLSMGKLLETLDKRRANARS